MAIDLTRLLEEHRACMEQVAAIRPAATEAAQHLRNVIEAGGTILVCGNGGSAADAQHFAAELSGRFERDRPGYPAVALTTDSSALTAISNDYGFEQVFARQVSAVGRKGDCLIVISTSGGSPNLIAAVEAAKSKHISTIGLLGRDGGVLAKMVDHPVVVAAQRTSRIQEAHIFLLHAWCEAFEQ